jgi:hypothetical protein
MHSILYLLVNEEKSSFKIGITDDLEARYARLSTIWGNFDLALSCTVSGIRQDISRLEKTLHYLLEKWRIQQPIKSEGYSEWFSMDCFNKAIEIIYSTAHLRGTYSENIITTGIFLLGQEKPRKKTNQDNFDPVNDMVNLGKRRTVPFAPSASIIGERRGVPVYTANPSIPAQVDKECFAKLFLAGVKQAAGLSKAGLAIFEVVYNLLRESPNSDEVKLNLYVASDQIGDIAERTYQRGLRELLDKEFLYRSPSEGVFFVNIRYMFNGDRLAFVKAYHLAGSAAVKRAGKKRRLASDSVLD